MTILFWIWIIIGILLSLINCHHAKNHYDFDLIVAKSLIWPIPLALLILLLPICGVCFLWYTFRNWNKK